MTNPEGTTSDSVGRDTSHAPSSKTKRKLSLSARQIAAIVLLILAIVFIAENTQHVKIRVIAGPKVTAPVWAALLAAAVLGALIAALARWRHNRKSG